MTLRKVSRTMMVVISVLVFLGLIRGVYEIGFSTFRIGYMNATTLALRQEMNQNWRLGHRTQAGLQFIQVVGMSVDAGIRQRLADQLYVQGAKPLADQGKPVAARDFCQVSIVVLGGYDPSGSRQYQCDRLASLSNSFHPRP